MPCSNNRRREDYLDEILVHLRGLGFEVKKGGPFKYGFSLAKWRKATADNTTKPGCFVYCTTDAGSAECRDVVCLVVPNDWPTSGEPDALRVRRQRSHIYPKTHYDLEFLTPSGNLVDPSMSRFKPEIGDRIADAIRVLDVQPDAQPDTQPAVLP